MIKCIIVDDEPAAHYVLNNYIDKSPYLELVGQCYNALDAINFIKQNPTDLVFLDIDMPEISGIEFLSMVQNPPKVILTTAHSEFALESYDYGVVDYLLKPIALSRFYKSIDRLISLANTPELETPKILNFRIDGQNVDIATDSIKYFQSYGNYVKMFTKTRVYLITSTTQELLMQLPNSIFFRIHKSYIVSLYKVKDFSNGYLTIDEEQIPVGITYKRELQERLLNISN